MSRSANEASVSADQPPCAAPRRPVSRWKASGIHLLISAAIASVVLVTMLEVWYPPPLFEAAGGENLLFILIGVDVVIGPLVTLIIFDTVRKSMRALKFDLAVIGLLQLAALGYGCYTVFLARPAYIVYTNDRFDVVTVKDLSPENLADASRPEYRTLPLSGPKLVAARLPADPRERERLLSSALEGADVQAYPRYYVPFEDARKDVLANARPLSKLLARDAETRQVLERAASSLGRKGMEELRFLPVRAKQRDYAALIDAATGAVVGYAMVDPWY